MPNIKKTHEQFVKDYNAKYPNITVISQYISTKDPITLSCNKCGFEWTKTAINAFGCPNCERNRRKATKTHEEYLNELKARNIIDIVPLEKYVSCQQRILHKSLRCGHEWRASPNNILNGTGCPICNSDWVLVGFNDMWTTNPELASLLANPNDGYLYTKSCSAKLDWKCPECGQIIHKRLVANINKQGLRCPFCSDGISLPNKFMGSVLNYLGITFDTEAVFKWAERKLYDFYIPQWNCIIEVHGRQHFEEGNNFSSGNSLADIQQNDNIKKVLALENGIRHYIIIDARLSELEWIKNNIINSSLNTLCDLNNVHWDYCFRQSLNSKMIEACNLFNNRISISNIAKELHVNHSTISSYLKRGADIGLCDYDPNTSRNSIVICLNTLEIFKSVKDAIEKYPSSKHLSGCCTGHRHFSGKHPITGDPLRWAYLKDYEKQNNSTSQGAS